MKLYCRHCGKQIEDTDKFCKYCGGNLADCEEICDENNDKKAENTDFANSEGANAEISDTEKKPESAKKGFFSRFRKGARDENGKYVSKTVLEDRVYEERTIIKEKHIESSQLYSLSNIILVKRGSKKSLLTSNLIFTIICFFGAIGLAAAAIVSRTYITNDTIAYITLFGSIIVMFIAFAWFVECFYSFRGLNELVENKITVKKYGLKKPAELLLNGEVYEVVLTTDCSMCGGEETNNIIGDLHIERVADKLIAVCNLNRRHIWHIDENALMSGVADKSLKILPKGEKPIIKKSQECDLEK